MINSTGSRKTPYTNAGIKRMACTRCGKPSTYQWNICSDGNAYRPICLNCDIALNELVLRFMNFPDWESKMDEYRKKVSDDSVK